MSILSVIDRKNSDGSRSYYYYFRLNGERHRGVIKGARTRAQAEKAARKIQNDTFEGKYEKPNGQRTLKDFIEKDYLPWAKAEKRSWRNDKSRVKPIIEFLGNRRLGEIAPFHVEAFRIKRRASQVVIRRAAGQKPIVRQRSKSAVNRELQLLSRIFSLAMKRRQASANPCQKELHENGLLLKGDNRRNRLLSDNEESRLMNALTGDREYLEPIVALALGTAMRRGNILSLTWMAVDFERACIYVTRTKADRNYSVPMNREVIEILRCLRTKSKSDYLFPNPKTGRPLNDVKRAFESACREAGIEDLWFHDLRRTAATRMADKGVPLSVIQGILGHSDINTTMRYVQVIDGTKREAVSALEKAAQTGAPSKWCPNEGKKRAS